MENFLFLKKRYHMYIMNYNYNEDFQYDGCISRGICSVNPRTSALQEVLILYLKLTAFYAYSLYKNDNINKNAKELILNTISIMVSNPEFSENDFESLIAKFKNFLPEIIKEANVSVKDESIESIKTLLKLDQDIKINNYIQLGEKEYLKHSSLLDGQLRDLYKILFVLAKSVCINVLYLESYDEKTEDGYETILRLLNSLNTKKNDKNEISELIIDVAKIDNKLMQNLRSAQEKRYGKQREKEVSYSTQPGKAVLVVGSNIRELEEILEALKDTNIDVYTHDEMMLANSFPKFEEYKNLKGQFGQGIENCLLDFATFPGPIILTQHSLYNVEHLYRGRLYTTDFGYSKGVISIKNKDFSNVIKASNDSKGFKTGKICESIKIGFDFDKTIANIIEKIPNYSQIFILGQGGYTLEHQAYFEKLKSQTPKDILILALSGNTNKSNIINLNACFDNFAIIRLAEELSKNTEKQLTLFFPECDRHTISQMVYLKELSNINIYVGKCTPVLLNPSLQQTLKNFFDINSQTTVKNDLADILEKK